MNFDRADVKLTGIDHIVLCVADVRRTVEFYTTIFGMQPREERPGKWSLHFGSSKISLQDARTAPAIAAGTTPGSGNYCVLTDDSIEELAETLRRHGVDIIAGPDERDGATGRILSVYFRDPDGNLIEVSRPLRGVAHVPSGTESPRPFLPTRDFEVSKDFYESLGFGKIVDGEVAVFRAGSGVQSSTP